MNEIKISFDNCVNRSKPNSYNTRSIKERIAEKIHRVNQDNLKSFVNFVGKNGCTFSPATFKTTFEDIAMNRESFEQMQSFPLDFNGGISFDDVMSRAKQYDLSVFFAYETLGSKNQDRFRVVFLNDASIKYVKVAEIMTEALLTIFPEADSGSRDVTQIYFGGKQLLYFDESVPTINIELLFRNMCLYLRDRYGDKNYHRNIYDFSNRTGLALNQKKYFDISVMKSSDEDKVALIGSDETLSPNSIIYIIDIGDKSSSHISKFYYRVTINNSINQLSSRTGLSSDKKSSKIHQKHRSYTLLNTEEECQLFRAFKDGTQILTSDELHGISTSLIQAYTGSEKFMQIIRKHAYFDGNPEKYSAWEYYLSYMKKNDYNTQSCDRFCPYRNQCHHAGDIISTTNPKQHTTKRLANFDCDKNYYHIDEAAADFEQTFTTVMDADISTYANIHAINAPVGVGKSTTVLKFMKLNPDRPCLVAPPTNDLKNKYYNDAIAQGIRAVKSPSLIEDKDKLPTKVWNHIQGLYQTGKHHEVMEYIREVISKQSADRDSLEILKNYLQDMTAFYNSNCHAFTTHSMVSTMDYCAQKKYDAVIFDEDPILNCMIANQVEIPIPALEKVPEEINSSFKLAKKIKAAAEATATESWFTLQSIPYEKVYSGISTPIDIPSFCSAEKFYFKKKTDENHSPENTSKEDSIVFFKPFKLDHRIKHVILSATVDQTICNYCFGANRVNFYECKKAKNIGTLNQYPQYATSHTFVKKNPDVVKKMIRASRFDKIITFKGEDYAMDSCHYGKTTGIDALKGENLTVIGTYHRPEWLYKLFAYTLGSNFWDMYKDAVMHYQPVRHKEFKFHFMTYDKNATMLRNIQFWMIESELEQAVGRARLLRCDCTVNLFSNFPLSQANIIDCIDFVED